MEEIKRLQEKLEKKSAQDIIKWSIKQFGNKVQLASSFSAEDMVLTDMIAKVKKDAVIFTLDTGRLPQATYDLMDEVKQKYSIKLKIFFPDTEEIEKMTQEHGVNLFYINVDST